MTGAALLTRVRRLLHDEDRGGERWPDVVLYAYIEDAVHAVYVRRPELFLTGSGLVDAPTDVGAATELVIADRWREALAAYVCFLALGEDGDDSENARASAQYFQQFKDALRVQ